MTNKEEAWIQTFSGTVFNPFNPDPSTISINDIAHALSQICRFPYKAYSIECWQRSRAIVTATPESWRVLFWKRPA